MIAALFVIAVILEAVLFLGADKLLDTRRRSALQESLEKAMADLQEARGRVEQKRAALRGAVEEAGRALAEREKADAELAESRKHVPTLVYLLGEVGSGQRYRAPLSKELPPTAEPPQKLVWACRNFVEVWASSADSASGIATSQFSPQLGYAVGEFTAVTSEPARQTGEQAA
jgi:hypothetical protein